VRRFCICIGRSCYLLLTALLFCFSKENARDLSVRISSFSSDKKLRLLALSKKKKLLEKSVKNLGQFKFKF
jgi:hypothetical protein